MTPLEADIDGRAEFAGMLFGERTSTAGPLSEDVNVVASDVASESNLENPLQPHAQCEVATPQHQQQEGGVAEEKLDAEATASSQPRKSDAGEDSEDQSSSVPAAQRSPPSSQEASNSNDKDSSKSNTNSDNSSNNNDNNNNIINKNTENTEEAGLQAHSGAKSAAVRCLGSGEEEQQWVRPSYSPDDLFGAEEERSSMPDHEPKPDDGGKQLGNFGSGRISMPQTPQAKGSRSASLKSRRGAGDQTPDFGSIFGGTSRSTTTTGLSPISWSVF